MLTNGVNLTNIRISGAVGSPKFICMGINFSDHFDQQITDS